MCHHAGRCSKSGHSLREVQAPRLDTLKEEQVLERHRHLVRALAPQTRHLAQRVLRSQPEGIQGAWKPAPLRCMPPGAPLEFARG